MIPLIEPFICGNEWEYIKESLENNWVSSVGPFIERFEDDFARYLGAEHAVGTINGTAAIHTALKVLGIGEGDEVIVPTLTFVASANPVLYCRATPVFVDAESLTWNIDPAKIEEVITPHTRAVVPVHLYGHPADMDPILELAKKYKLWVVEDATESPGSKYKGKAVGTLGDIGCFSFNGNKLITTGGGGMLVTDNGEYAKRARFLTTQAKNAGMEYYHPEVGYNYRLTNIQAAMGVAQLEQVDEFIEKKRWIAETYRELLTDIPGISLCQEQPWAYCNFWMFSVLVDEQAYGMGKEKLLAKFAEAQIQARPFFMPLHKLPPFKSCPAGNISVALRLHEQGINLPCSVGITSSQIEQVVQVLVRHKNG
jgi:perosamine synthetase